MIVFHDCLCVDLIYNVEEEKSPGTYIGNIATDSHVMDNIPLKYHKHVTFTQLQKGSSKLFRVSKNTGKLYTAKILDAESLCNYNMECFKMIDVAVRNAKSFIKLLEVKVFIKDVNDHQPEFPDKKINIEFDEGDGIGMKKYIPNAIDEDISGPFSKITYQLKKEEEFPFTLSISKTLAGTSDLIIILKERLDRELKDSYILQVVAADGGSPPKKSTLVVYIAANDINDNVPVFSQSIYNITIKNELNENIPIVILSATDLDSGQNGNVSYYFNKKTTTAEKSYFRLNHITGEIFLLQKIPTGGKLTYNLYVEAADAGTPSLSSLAMVQVNVINQQNNAPTINVNFFAASSTDNSTSVSEDIEVGSFIAYVKVTDHDAGQNGEVICDLHHDKFKLKSQGLKKYQVILKDPLDRETEEHHDITISCEDMGFPPRHSESKFSIKVMDVNDVKPKFSKARYKFRISENQKAHIDVGSINASDPDLGPGGELIFSLATNKKKSHLPFLITKDGFISTSKLLDHELEDVYKFEVLVKDNGIPSLNNTVDVIVEVEDENDNSPYFTFPSVNPYNLEVIYFADESKNVTVVRAHDSDSQENAFLRYEISAGNEKQLFTIDHYSGLLSSTGALTKQDAGSYELEFVVKDSGMPVLSATTTIFLSLIVKNKTSSLERVNGVLQRSESDEKVHLNMVIIITVAAVMVTIILTASISICVLRCCNAASVDGDDVSNRYVSEQRHLMSSSYRGSSWPDVPTTMINDPNFGMSAEQMAANRRESYPSFINQSTAIRPHAAVDINCQVGIFVEFKSLEYLYSNNSDHHFSQTSKLMLIY